ncbi:Eukaryotic Translation Initiation Factor 5 [Manis pentadactyla]|nr:Eukaryotic Translation Initiation Factor 5 [Manis pentadactyla]
MTRHRSLMTSGDDDETDISINDTMQCSGLQCQSISDRGMFLMAVIFQGCSTSPRQSLDRYSLPTLTVPS